MALPMVHLLAAWAWAQDKPELKSNPDYYLGAISPDAIHIRDGNDKSHKNEIHLNNWRTPDPDRVLSYWKTHHSAFDIGYGMHVLLDGQWTVNFRQNAPGVLMSDGRPNPEIYYRDTCVTDFDFYSQSPLSMHLMELAERGKAPEEHPLLTAAEIDAWRRDIVAFYRRPCPKEGPAQFIDCAFVEDFLSRCNPLIDQTYRRLQMMNETQRSILDRRSNRGFTGEALTRRFARLIPEHTFEFVIASSDYGVRKPDPLIFRAALSRAGLPAEDCWYCGNELRADVLGALGAGLLPVYYAPPGAETADVPALCIRHWRELLLLLDSLG